MWKNPIVTAICGLLLGFLVGYVVGQGASAGVPAPAGGPHAGVPGAPPLGEAMPPPQEGRAGAVANPRLMEQLKELNQLLEKDPNNYEHMRQIANVHFDLGDYVKAADYYEKARAVRDDSADVLTDLGVCYRETNRAQRALELFRRAVKLDPSHWQSRYNAAIVLLFDLNDPEGAAGEVEQLKQLRASVPGIPDLSGLEQEIAKRSK